MKDSTKAVISAAKLIDWDQIRLNGGPACFHLEKDGHFCGRAERWIGHLPENHHVGHPFVSLAELIAKVAT